MTTLDPTRDLRTADDRSPQPAPAVQAEALATRVARVERTSGVLWMALGAFEIMSLYLAVAGIWNFFTGYSRLRSSGRIKRRETRVPSIAAHMAGLLLLVLVNMVFGIWWATPIAVLDVYVRYQLQRNRAIFTR